MMKTLTALSGTEVDGTWSSPAQQTTIIDATNPVYPRLVLLSSNGVSVQRPGYAAGVPLADLIAAMVTLENHLTWPPIVTVQPVPTTALTALAPVTFPITVTSEISVTYQWKYSTDSGVTWTNLTNAGVYSGVS